MTEDATIKQLNGIWTYQNNTLWYVPGLGTVKVRIDTTTYSGSGTVLQGSLQATAILNSTSVSY